MTWIPSLLFITESIWYWKKIGNSSYQQLVWREETPRIYIKEHVWIISSSLQTQSQLSEAPFQLSILIKYVCSYKTDSGIVQWITRLFCCRDIYSVREKYSNFYDVLLFLLLATLGRRNLNNGWFGREATNYDHRPHIARHEIQL